MNQFNSRIAVVDHNHAGLWDSTKEFFSGYFNYQPVRYRVISNNELKVQIKAEEADSHYIIKIISLITMIFPLIGGICLFNKWLRSGQYEVLPSDNTLPSSINPLTLTSSPEQIKVVPEKVTELPKKEIKSSSADYNKKQGYAPNRQAAIEFLRHPSIVPGSSVYYYDEELGQTKCLTLEHNDQRFIKFQIQYRNFVIPVEIVSGSPKAGTVKYLEKGEKIEGQPWEDYLPYQEALRLIFLENPSYDYFYIKALRNGKLVYLSTLRSQNNNEFNVLCTSKPPRNYRPYDPRSLSRTWPFYEEEGKKVLTNLSVVDELLDLQEKKDRGRYVCFAKYNPIVQNSALWYAWKEKKEISYSMRPPEGSLSFEFGEEDIEDCFHQFTTFEMDGADSKSLCVTRSLKCIESFEN